MKDEKIKISSDMTVLDIVSAYKETVDVFQKYDKHAGECICCNALFESLDKVASKYRIDLDKLLNDLNKV